LDEEGQLGEQGGGDVGRSGPLGPEEMLPAGEVAALGRPGGDDVLLLILPSNGSGAVTRRMRLVDGHALVSPAAPWKVPFDAIGSVAWAPEASHALLGSLTIAGQPRARLSRWDWNCLAP